MDWENFENFYEASLCVVSPHLNVKSFDYGLIFQCVEKGEIVKLETVASAVFLL